MYSMHNAKILNNLFLCVCCLSTESMHVFRKFSLAYIQYTCYVCIDTRTEFCSLHMHGCISFSYIFPTWTTRQYSVGYNRAISFQYNYACFRIMKEKL